MIAFYGSILLIALAATSQRPQADQPDLASDDFVTYYMSSPPLPLANKAKAAVASLPMPASAAKF
ncbi:hypothetical protein [Tardiphaga robiniae]|uniref:hypothetical protein n=1 Tax=Tardiphaga robiniae TaxID=943830 RepID=UPI001112578E|nr:hypothetical protein [Tardiphaga robiniae]